MLYAHDLEMRGRAPCAVFTFGSPRVGDLDWTTQKRSYPVIRVANSEDLVPRVPPLCGHVGEEVILSFDRGSILLNHDLAEYARSIRIGTRNREKRRTKT